MDNHRSINAESIVSNPFTVNFIRSKAAQLCRRPEFSSSDREDLQQDMRLYLLEKADQFDSNKGNLESFVTGTLRTWVAMKLRHDQRQKRRCPHESISLESTMIESDEADVCLAATLTEEDGRRRTGAYPISDIEQFELRETIDQAMDSLEPSERQVWLDVAEHGLAATARSRGMSRRQITAVLDSIRHRLKDML